MKQGWNGIGQAQGHYQFRDEDNRLIAACALGAACYAVAPDEPVYAGWQVRGFFPQLFDRVSGFLPETDLFNCPLEDLIVDLNDRRAASPSRIVAIVEALGF
jgi:hypothetical protein